MGAQPTASKTALLLQCPRPFAEETPLDEAREGEDDSAARWGSAVHEGAARLLNGEALNPHELVAKWGLLSAPDGRDANALTDACLAVIGTIKGWCGGDNDWGVPFRVIGVEESLAARLIKRKGGPRVITRPVEFDPETHTYDLRAEEFAGTYDILADYGNGDKSLRAVIDIKTGPEDWHGGSFAEPKTIDQLMTLALMTGANIVAVLHAPRGEVPVMYAQEVTPTELAAHANKLHRALNVIESGFIRPGRGCRWCPARESCPAKDGELLVRASSLVKSVTARPLELPVDLGEFHMMYQEMTRLMGRARDEMVSRIKAGEIHQRPDGAVLELQSRAVRSLSMASIKRALGGPKGEALISDLEARGCVETRTTEYLVASKKE